ncbi:hypothetical protein D3C71_2228580 [compost metagenome]
MSSKCSECSIYLSICSKLCDHSFCWFFVDYIQGFPFIFFRVLDVAEYKDEALFFAWFKRNVKCV